MNINRDEIEELIPRLKRENLDQFSNDIHEIENLLKNSLQEEQELEPVIGVLLEIVNVLKEDIESVRDMTTIPLRKEISLLSHLTYLEQLMSDLVYPFEDMSDEDYDETEEFEAWEDEEEGECCGGHSCHEPKQSSLINLDFFKNNPK